MDLGCTKDSLSQAVTAFGLDVYNKLNKSGACKNVFISPLSISAAMAMVVGGAMGSTKTQMEKALHFVRTPGDTRLLPASAGKTSEVVPEQESEERATSEFKKLLLQLNNLSPAYQLNLANNLFIQAGHKFLQQYLTFTKETFGAMLQTVDFSNAVEEAREIINLEIERQTQGTIKELFAPGVIGPEAVLVLGNAVYFKATWEHQFDPNCTVERAFRLSKNASKPVHMMHQKGIFKLGYMRGTNARILCLPYVGEVLSMLIMLPKDIGDLEQVESAMTCENFAHWTASENMEEDHVEVYIPRFKLEDSFDLNMTLQALGMIDVFDKSKANLSGMSPSHPLFLSNVLHKAFLEVNEEGTEAAAVAGAVISIRSLVTYDLFLVDHPFLFCIQHNPTNTVLFLGKLCSP
ncbi:leukocyte elastase inhibitor A-like [Varanus komodoensis]|uniref:leukocyte elastase inhibitor A-like n=1 Tax=Varanus komodoensis TaxID=61221 RepID=UPI001CF791B3|nr:leukocyte elastase inhibitor A-like [Varanus komodoensis]